MGIFCIEGRILCFFVWRIDGFCSLVVLLLFCMCSLSPLVFVEIARRVETCLLGLGCIDTSCRILLRVGFFVTGSLVVGCGCGEHIIRSINCNKLHGEVIFGSSWLKTLEVKR